MTNKEKALQAVREACPELMEPVNDSYGVVNHPPQLQHWLRLLGVTDKTYFTSNGVDILVEMKTGEQVVFSLTDGQPRAESDYQTIVDIIGV